MVSNNNYIHINGFMIKDLKLKGNDLLVYAVIYGFSQDGETKFTGSYQYIADMCNISKRTAMTIISNLVDKGLVIKEEVVVNSVKYNRYSTQCKTFTPSEEISLPPSEKISPNNNIYNNIKENNNTNVLLKESFKKPTLNELNEYIMEHNYHFLAEDFINHYESVGWKIGNSKMKSWKAACKTWESNYKKRHNIPNTTIKIGRKIDDEI